LLVRHPKAKIEAFWTEKKVDDAIAFAKAAIGPHFRG
jgi:hypothetical protein